MIGPRTAGTTLVAPIQTPRGCYDAFTSPGEKDQYGMFFSHPYETSVCTASTYVYLMYKPFTEEIRKQKIFDEEAC